MLELEKKVAGIKAEDLATDLLPLFESMVFVDTWINASLTNFADYAKYYLLASIMPEIANC